MALEEKPVEGTKDLDAPAFTNALESVINYKGDNYYKACGYIVRQTEYGTTSCVKRAGHPSTNHEDYYGVTAQAEEKIFNWTTATAIPTAVGEAVGAASMCWERPEDAGVFDSTRAKQIADELIDFFQSKGPIY